MSRPNIDQLKNLLEQYVIDKKEEAIEDGCSIREKHDAVWNEILQMILNYRKPNCPLCRKGRLHFAGVVTRNHGAPG